jgi:hypothetical protein
MVVCKMDGSRLKAEAAAAVDLGDMDPLPVPVWFPEKLPVLARLLN